jgi:hypothetical protein
VQEAARDLTSLGSIIVLVIITAAVSIYLFLGRKYAQLGSCWWPCGALVALWLTNLTIKKLYGHDAVKPPRSGAGIATQARWPSRPRSAAQHR